MRTRFIIALLAATTLAPAAAFAQASTATGAVGGAVVGGAVGGPVGAVIGAGVGSTVGLAAEPPGEVVTYVQREQVPSVAVQEHVVVGQPLPAAVELRTVPSHTEYRYAVVNNQRVIVEPKTRKVIKIIQ
jgi:phage tail tape-measure protein